MSQDVKDPEVRIGILWEDRERHFRHYEDIKEKLDVILTKISSLPCDLHDGKREVLSTKIDGFKIQLTGMWCVIGVVFFVILGVGMKVILGAH